MKQCNSCQEQVGDKFAFCPVCGTPLQNSEAVPVITHERIADTFPAAAPEVASNGHSFFSEPEPTQAAEAFSADPEPSITMAPPTVPAAVDPATAVVPGEIIRPTNSILNADAIAEAGPVVSDAYLDAAGGDATSYIHDDGEYHLTIMDDSGLVNRLSKEVKGVARASQLTWPEFKRDPVGFFKRSASGYGQMASGFFGNRYISIALAMALLALLVVAGAIILADRSHSTGSSRIGMSIFAVFAFALLSAILVSWLTRGNSTVVIGGEERDKTAATVGVGIALGLPLLLVGAIIFFLIFPRLGPKSLAPQNPNDDLTVENIVDIPDAQPTPKPGDAGMDKGKGGGSKPQQEKPGGGGGGGREEQTPASQGKLPMATNSDPIVAPNPKPPPPTADPLVVPPSINADPTLFPQDTSSRNFGDPNSKETATSSGPGTNGGIGNGDRAGVGPGSGNGYGPGNGRNTGGGDPNDGGGGPGGGGGGTDYNKIFNAKDVTQKVRILSKPSPEYTEQARVNNTIGTVRLRAVFSSSGQVTNISPLNQLPYGLTDKAIAAARRIQFSPAMKDGRAVSSYMVIEYNFNIY